MYVYNSLPYILMFTLMLIRYLDNLLLRDSGQIISIYIEFNSLLNTLLMLFSHRENKHTNKQTYRQTHQSLYPMNGYHHQDASYSLAHLYRELIDFMFHLNLRGLSYALA